MASAIEFAAFSLTLRTARGPKHLLRNVHLQIASGGFYLLVGGSGGGKSTLLALLAGLREPRVNAPQLAGSLRVLGREVGERDARVVAILQDEGLLDELTPQQNVALALRRAARSPLLAAGLLAQAGLADPPQRTADLSGGMRKRVAVARALALEPELLLCDEPTAGLDQAAAKNIASLLRQTHDAGNGRTTVVITHDVAAFAGLVDGVLVLDAQHQTLRFSDAVVAEPPVPLPAAELPIAWPASRTLKQLLLSSCAVGETVLESLLRLPPVELRECARSVGRFCAAGTPLVALSGAVLGGLAMFFGLRSNPIQGGFESAIVAGTGKVSLAVLVPLLCGFFFTARVAAGATARLGTQQRTNQIAALRTLGIRPADLLLTPMVWGMVIAMPVVTLAGMVAAAHAAALAACLAAQFSFAAFVQAYGSQLDPVDLLLLLGKAALSGYLVALVCYHHGTAPKASSRDVGEAVNRAGHHAMFLVLLVHALLTFVAYV